MTPEDVVVAYVAITAVACIITFIGASMVRGHSIDALKCHLIGHSRFKWWRSTLLIGIGFFLLTTAARGVHEMLAWEPPPPIKLIILDVDGVLNHNKAPERLNVSHLYDPECVARLNGLIEKHHAKLLVCSAWRIGQTIESMQEILESIGVKGEVIGLTPWYRGYHTRDDEITAWLSNYDDLSDVYSMILLDDDSSIRFREIQVKPSWDQFGLLDHHIDQASILLSQKLPENFDIGKVEVCKSTASKETSFGGHFIQKKLLEE